MVGTNGCNGYASLNEINFCRRGSGSQNVNLSNPSQATSPNVVGDIRAPRTNELMFGVDREIMPNFGVSATFTYRHIGDILWNLGIGVTPADYVQTERSRARSPTSAPSRFRSTASFRRTVPAESPRIVPTTTSATWASK